VEVSSRAALQRILTGKYAVVMVDMRMPDLDGPALYQEVTARSPHLGNSFVFITGDSFSPAIDRFLKETQAVYLDKPCTFNDVDCAVVRALLRSGHDSARD
jgi:DNA-binding NtrC family response regulator